MASVSNIQFCTLIPYYGGQDSDHLACVNALKEKMQYMVHVHGIPYIDMARAALATIALDSCPEIDYFLWIDHDILFMPDQAIKMVENCAKSDYDILGAIYSFRRTTTGVIGKFASSIKNVQIYKPGLYDADWLGMGFTVVKRRVFEELVKTNPKINCPTVNKEVYPFFSHLINDKGYYGEDISFCWRVKQAGFKIGIDAEPRILHRGRYDYALDDMSNPPVNHEFLDMSFNYKE